MRICGIDPGLNTTGYGVIDFGSNAHRTKLVEAGVVRTAAADPMQQRLAELNDAIAEILSEYEPELIGLEELYSHYRHPKTAILMGHARGVLLLEAGRRDLEVMSLPASRVKSTLTGNGHASKAQMQQAIMATLNLSSPPDPPDVADALAIALCAGIQVNVDVTRRSAAGAPGHIAGGEVPAS